MDTIYLVVWHGGYEPPSYFASKGRSKAKEQYLEWTEQATEGEDTVDVIRLVESSSGTHINSERLTHEEVLAL